MTMTGTLDAGSLAAMAVAMTALAAMPSLSVFAVSSRAASAGFAHGALTALGVVLGDVIFILLALFGLKLLAETLGGLFFLVSYAASAYLIWMGLRLWRTTAPAGGLAVPATTALSSFSSGLLLTLGDQKAVLFYLGFLPAFVDLARATRLDVALIIVITLLTVGGVKLVYAYAASRAGAALGARNSRLLNHIAAAVMIAAGVLIAVRMLP